MHQILNRPPNAPCSSPSSDSVRDGFLRMHTQSRDPGKQKASRCEPLHGSIRSHRQVRTNPAHFAVPRPHCKNAAPLTYLLLRPQNASSTPASVTVTDGSGTGFTASTAISAGVRAPFHSVKLSNLPVGFRTAAGPSLAT